MVPLFDVNGLDMDEISDIFDCFQIQVTQNIQLPHLYINFSNKGLKQYFISLFLKNRSHWREGADSVEAMAKMYKN